jgi:hypothetical protein
MKTVIFLISILLSSIFVNAQISQTVCKTSSLSYSIKFNAAAFTQGDPYSDNFQIVGIQNNNNQYSTISGYSPSTYITYYNYNTTPIFTVNLKPAGVTTTFNVIYDYTNLHDYSYGQVNITFQLCTDVIEAVNISSIEIYPNPFTDNVNLKINALESSKTSIILIDMLGKVYENKEIEIIAGENNISLPVNCPTGIYFLSFVLDNKTITYKIIK